MLREKSPSIFLMKNMQEIWKDIDNYIGKYQISNLGRVKSLPRNGTICSERILKIQKDRKGYSYVSFHKKKFKVHRLVAQAFIPNLENKPQVNHIDGNKQNNNINNLEWATAQENIQHSLKTGLRDYREIKKALQYARLKNIKPIIQYDLLGNFIKKWESATEIQNCLGYKAQNVGACCLGKYKKSNGFIWQFEEEK